MGAEPLHPYEQHLLAGGQGNDRAAPRWLPTLLDALVAASPVVAFSFDADGRCTWLDGRRLDVLGLVRDELVGQSLLERCAGYPEIVDGLLRCLAGQSGDLEFELADRRWEVVFRPVRGPGGDAAGGVGVTTDVSGQEELLAIERAARGELQKFASLVELSGDYIAMADLDRTVIYVNRAGRELLGLAGEEEACGRPIEDFHTEAGQAVEREMAEATWRFGRWEGAGQLRHFVTGEAIAVWGRTFLVPDPDTGKPLALATVQRDLRRQNEIEDRLRRAADQLTQRVAEQRAVAELGRTALNANLGTLLDRVVHAVAEPVEAASSLILRFDPGAGGLAFALEVKTFPWAGVTRPGAEGVRPGVQRGGRSGGGAWSAG